jgi:hypothetical protein
MIIIDNFIKDRELLQGITSNRLWSTPCGYSWKPFGSKDLNIYEILISKVWSGNISEYMDLPPEYAGIEYWINNMSNSGISNFLEPHMDKDEYLYNTKHILRTPEVGMVYYAHKTTPEGGFLEIEASKGGLQRIEPLPNRLIIFNPSIKHQVTKVTKGTRRTIASNIWLKKPCENNFSI